MDKTTSTKKYAKATTLYVFGNIFNKAISLLLLPVFTRLLSTSSYGIVSTYNSWVTIATVVIGLQLCMTLRTAYGDYKESISRYISAINSLIFITFAFVLAVACFISFFLLKNVSIFLVIFCCLHAFFTAIINVELQKEMMSFEYVKRTVLLAAPNLLGAIVGIIVILLIPKSDYWGRIISNVGVYAVFGITIFAYYLKKGRCIYDKQIWSYALPLALPLIFHGLAVDILSSFDKTMITAFRSSEETGIYSVAYTIGMAITVITTSVESVWIPWFTQKMNDNNKKAINEVAVKYLFGVTILCIAAMLCLPEILKLFSDSSYWCGVYIIPPVVLASFITFLYSLSVDVEYYYKSTKRIAINTIIAAVMNVVLNILFIPKYGAIAAAYTTVISYVCSFIIHYLGSRKLDSALFSIKIYILPILIAISATIFAYFMMDFWIARWIVAFSMMIVLVFAFIKMGGFKLLKSRNKERL